MRFRRRLEGVVERVTGRAPKAPYVHTTAVVRLLVAMLRHEDVHQTPEQDRGID